MAGYSKTPLIKKLAMKENMRGIFLHIPQNVKKLFQNAPLDIANRFSGTFDYIHLFSKTERQLKTDFPKARKALASNGILWVSWPKAGKLDTDLNENRVREIGLTDGLIDIKVAAIDETWSGLKFVYRIKDR